MGKFILQIATLKIRDGKTIVNGEDCDQKYPGYRFASMCSSETVYEAVTGNDCIVEVFGEGLVTEDSHGQPVLARDTVAVLHREDAKLYEKLQWLDPWRTHDSIRTGKAFLYVIVGFVLLGVQFIGGMVFLWEGGTVWEVLKTVLNSFFFSAFAVALELSLFALGCRVFRICLGFLNVLSHIFADKIKRKKPLSYYRKIFESLSRANCRDKAQSARIMARALSFATPKD